MKCCKCNKRLPLFFGRKKRIDVVFFNKELGRVECQFCSRECYMKYAKEWDAEILKENEI
jgi:hypothetical protein